MATLITGATGMVGAELLVRLLEQGEEVVAVVRDGGEGAEERIRRLLRTRYELTPDPARLRVAAGDLTRPLLGLRGEDLAYVLREVGAIVHSAANVRFDLSLLDALATNTLGTKHVLELARELREAGALRRVTLISTAFVAGQAEGRFHERDLDVGQGFRNSYERSKFEAECLADEHRDLPSITIRPSIIVGERGSGWTPAFNVIYPPLRAYARGLIENVPIDPTGRLDIVPLDYVADATLALHGDASAQGRYHLVAGVLAPTNQELVHLVAGLFRRDPPRLTGSDKRFGELAPYLSVRTVFDDARARAALERTGLRTPPIDDYFERLLAYAEDTRWGREPLSRAAARRRRGASSLAPAAA
jgi:nucleoside-diphosphate-sugar epimerase